MNVHRKATRLKLPERHETGLTTRSEKFVSPDDAYDFVSDSLRRGCCAYVYRAEKGVLVGTRVTYLQGVRPLLRNVLVVANYDMEPTLTAEEYEWLKNNNYGVNERDTREPRGFDCWQAGSEELSALFEQQVYLHLAEFTAGTESVF